MRHILLLAVLLPALAAAINAGATVSLSASCAGDAVSVRVNVCNNYPSDLTGFVVIRQAVGTCDGPETLTPTPTPLPAPGNPYVSADWSRYDFSFTAPYAEMHYRYSVLFTDASGAARHHANGSFPTWDCQPVGSVVLACAEAVIMRGTFLPIAWSADRVTIMLFPCQAGCWGTPGVTFEVPADDPLVTQNPGGTMDLYGSLVQNNCFGVSTAPYDVTRFEPAPGGSCGPLPEEKANFGSLKAMYR